MNVLRSAFSFRLIAGVAVIVLASALSRPLAGWFLKDTAWAHLIALASAGVMGELLFRSVLNYFQSREVFHRYVLVEAVLQVGRFVTVGALVLGNVLTATTAVTVYVSVSYGVFLVSLTMLPGRIFRAAFREARRELVDVFHYSKWMVLALSVAALYERLDVFFLGMFHGPAAVGVYSAAFAIAILPDLGVTVVMTVIHPRVVDLYMKGEIRGFQSFYFRWAVPTGLAAGAVALTVGGYVIRLAFTDVFAGAIPVFRVLVTGTLFWFLISPLPMSLLALVVPKRILMVTSTQLLLMVAGGLVLIPAFGPMGAAALLASARLVIGIWLYWLAQKTIEENRKPVELAGISDPDPRIPPGAGSPAPDSPIGGETCGQETEHEH